MRWKRIKWNIWRLILLVSGILEVLVTGTEGFIRTNRCYSCMSSGYEPLFREGYFSKYFFEPRNFTDQCDHPMNPNSIGFVPCRTICLTLIQDLVVMGRSTGKRLTMRGCSTSMNRFGFVNRTMQIFDRYDMCREVKMSDLFNYDTDSQLVTMQWQRPEYGKIGFCVTLLFCGFIWISYNNQIDNIFKLTLFKERKEIEGFYDEIVNATENWSQANVEQWHFGNYCVWFNFTKAIQTPDEKSVTLCTHGTVGYSRFIFDHANYWNDQISLALLLDPAGFSALSAYQKFHKCTAASKRISTHLVWSQKYGNCSTDFVINGLAAQPPDLTPDDCNLGTHLALFNHNFQDPYPPNTLRNVARAGANTQGHLIADIENHFSQDAAEVIRTFTDTIQSNDTVIVIRRFESDENKDIPRNVSFLKKLVDQEKAGEFHFKFFPVGHSVPFLEEFFNYSTTPGTSPRLTPIEYQGSRWEPQMVVHQSHPFHFEGIPIRYDDQQVLSYELCRLRVNFTVASHVFSVHQGIKTKKSEKETLAREQAHEEGDFYTKQFREYLLETYPDTNNECGEF